MDHFLDEQSEVDDQCCYAAQALCRHRDRTVDESWPGLSLTLIKLGELPLNVTKIPHHVMDPVDIELTQQAPETLVTDISQGKWTSVQVAQAFLRRAALSQELVSNPLIWCAHAVLKASITRLLDKLCHGDVAVGGTRSCSTA